MRSRLDCASLSTATRPGRPRYGALSSASSPSGSRPIRAPQTTGRRLRFAPRLMPLPDGHPARACPRRRRDRTADTPARSRADRPTDRGRTRIEERRWPPAPALPAHRRITPLIGWSACSPLKRSTAQSRSAPARRVLPTVNARLSTVAPLMDTGYWPVVVVAVNAAHIARRGPAVAAELRDRPHKRVATVEALTRRDPGPGAHGRQRRTSSPL